MNAEAQAADSWLYATLSWMSPAWPIGAFAFSSGLEWAGEAGWLENAGAVEQWLQDSLELGQLHADAQLFAHVWQIVRDSPIEGALSEVAQLAHAYQGSAERALEATAQGAAFRRIAVAANRMDRPHQVKSFEAALAGIEDDRLTYPLAAGALFAVFNVPLEPALTAFLHASLSNLVSAAQRLVPLGHTEAQVLLVRLEDRIAACRSDALSFLPLPLDCKLASATMAADIACMRHEIQHTRLFRT